MNTQTQDTAHIDLREIRRQSFAQALASDHSLKGWEGTYLDLRGDGDSHSTAIETIRGEIQYAARMKSVR